MIQTVARDNNFLILHPEVLVINPRGLKTHPNNVAVINGLNCFSFHLFFSYLYIYINSQQSPQGDLQLVIWWVC